MPARVPQQCCAEREKGGTLGFAQVRSPSFPGRAEKTAYFMCTRAQAGRIIVPKNARQRKRFGARAANKTAAAEQQPTMNHRENAAGITVHPSLLEPLPLLPLSPRLLFPGLVHKDRDSTGGKSCRARPSHSRVLLLLRIVPGRNACYCCSLRTLMCPAFDRRRSSSPLLPRHLPFDSVSLSLSL